MHGPSARFCFNFFFGTGVGPIKVCLAFYYYFFYVAAVSRTPPPLEEQSNSPLIVDKMKLGELLYLFLFYFLFPSLSL